MGRRGYKGGTAATTLAGDINDTVTTIAAASLATWAGLTSNGPGTATINRGKSDEETITFTGISTNNLTGVTRGAAGTTQQAHSSGATIEQTSSVTDFDDANAHIFDTTRDDHTQYLKKALATTKGDLFVATGAGTLVRLGVGTDGQVLEADAASPGGVKWASASGGLLAIKQYAAGADGPYTVTNDNTLRALDTTNLTVSPVIPASGNVIVRQQIVVSSTDTVANRLYIGIRVHGSSTQVGLVILLDGSSRASGTILDTFNVSQYITGLTPGAATWDFAYISNTAATALWKGTGISGGVSPTLMEVWAA